MYYYEYNNMLGLFYEIYGFFDYFSLFFIEIFRNITIRNFFLVFDHLKQLYSIKHLYICICFMIITKYVKYCNKYLNLLKINNIHIPIIIKLPGSFLSATP